MKATNIQSRVVQVDWLAIHPYEKAVKSDFYFINLSNKILKGIGEFEKKGMLLSSETKKIALHVTAYFEDVISGLGLWQTFTRKHNEMYGKYLPFYQLDEDYTPDEINLSDVNYLVWQVVQNQRIYGEGEPTIINPENPVLLIISLGIYAILEEEYETAPSNEVLESFFSQPSIYDNFFKFRETASWLFYDSYLFCDYTQNLLKDTLVSDETLFDKFGEYANVMKYTVRSSFIFDEPCGPLALKLNYWLASMVGEDTAIGKRLLAMDCRGLINHLYLIEGETPDALVLKPNDGGENMLLAKDSYSQGFEYKQGHSVAQACLVYLDGYWHVNGSLMLNENESFAESEKEIESKRKGQQLFAEKLFEANNNKPIFFFADTTEMQTLLKKIFENYDTQTIAESGYQTNIMAFIDPVDGFVIFEDMALALKAPENPYYDKEEAFDIGAELFFSKFTCSRSLIDYIVKNKLMPDMGLNSLKGEEYGVMQIQDNLEFLFRFFKPCYFKK